LRRIQSFVADAQCWTYNGLLADQEPKAMNTQLLEQARVLGIDEQIELGGRAADLDTHP
jgi:hypothetical protein